MSQASVEEDGVSWIDDTGGPSCTENVSTMDSANLTPAEVQFTFWIYINTMVSWGSHREFLHRNGIGKTCLWKKKISL